MKKLITLIMILSFCKSSALLNVKDSYKEGKAREYISEV